MRYVGTLLKNMMFCFSLSIAFFSVIPCSQAQLFFSRIPPADIVSIVRNRGFYDVDNPYFRGDVYVIDATERRGLRVRLVVDPRTGDIVERLIVGRNNRVYPAGPNNAAEQLGVEKRIIERPTLDNDRQSQSSVNIEEPNPNIRQVRPLKRRSKQDSSVNIVTPNTVKPTLPNMQIIEVPKEEPSKLPASNVQSQPSSIEVPKTPSTPSASVSSQPKVLEPSFDMPATPIEGQTQRGTRENPRKVGPIISPPVGAK